MSRAELKDLALSAKAATSIFSTLSSEIKNVTILRMADDLEKKSEEIIAANKKDLHRNRKNLSKAMLDRLMLDEKRIHSMAQSLRQIAALSDPVGEVIDGWLRPNGLWIQKIRVPIGVIAIIYESRPNVTSDCVGLCLKSGNASILKGGKEALNTNKAIYEILLKAAIESGIPSGAINFIDSVEREDVVYLLKLSDCIDLVIPRGGEGLITFVQKFSKIPVVKHYKGICHTYVDKYASFAMAEDICFNAKVSRPGVCNAMETLLAHKDIALRFLPPMVKRYKDAGVEIRGCKITSGIVKDIIMAKESDWRTEYLDLILSIKVVENVAQAVEHINYYGSHHSESIVTENYENALYFLNRVDSACVYVNASTRFTDGYEFGMGAEIGISTDKIPYRGPMGLKELTTYKYIIFGNGQIRK